MLMPVLICVAARMCCTSISYLKSFIKQDYKYIRICRETYSIQIYTYLHNMCKNHCYHTFMMYYEINLRNKCTI